MKNKVFNILDIVRTRYIQVIKMVPLSPKIGELFALPLRMNIYLSWGRRTGLVRRVNQTRKFISFVLKLWRNHGSTLTIAWLKASSVALQRKLGQNSLKSLRELTPDLPLPRNNNGVPRHIDVQDRVLIRNGHVATIRFHLGLLNLYRVLQAPGVVKLSTILDPFKGDIHALQYLQDIVIQKKLIFFDLLSGFAAVRKSDLSPKGFILSRSASPSNKMSAQGIITDVHLMNLHRPDLWQDILDYLYLAKPSVTKFVRQLESAYQLGLRLRDPIGFVGTKTGFRWSQHSPLMEKSSLRAHGLPEYGKGLSQFAVKEEAAGKIRLFALVDSITQSTMAPLHDAEFALLKLIPNDGTFDQEASIRRSMNKASLSSCAYSYDLTAATDRLPVSLTSSIVEVIFNKEGLGDLWKRIMTNRNFEFNSKVAEKYKIPSGPYRYSVGQPMGALSSWPGLALTHHWILQYAYSNVHLRNFGTLDGMSWFENYEILGDDLVIFDRKVSEEYLLIMKWLGCEINLSKSIVSHYRPVFEFAKRTVWGNNIVSGISLNQVRAGWNVGSRVANALSFANTGLLTSPSLLASVLTRYANTSLDVKDIGLGLLALLGSLYQSGKVTHRVLAGAIVDPSNEEADFEAEAVGLPVRDALMATHIAINRPEGLIDYPWSHQDARNEVYDEYESEFATVLLQTALKRATRLYEDQELLLNQVATKMMMYGVYCSELPGKSPETMDMTPEYRLLLTQLEAFYLELIGQDDSKVNPETLYDRIYRILYKHSTYNHVKVEEALALLEEVENLEFKYTLEEPTKPGKTVLETTPILTSMRQMTNFLKVRAIHNSPNFRYSPLMG